ncbi:vesicular acetylcholine transporter-like isoform X1 [Anneissia japonica]|uniref:vesicular acetylcholine transporter-like isoform X1 n=1 Tax=Anneissia japonica TaxID=1529436 RepID=UPI0014259E5B|nr:vesicular acetylcholine transporter-like isoform X1 [Anneissia japonica]XP_033111896.1 vesicular acetylcholine transporter-like isoform X2 [Anneissia japonica]XP_033111897.1 vesicular acetylcholine transporter-like isoform X2 [Anneissia japonica]XP_033111898.1 vesicular acetylcholine transporter-like isoform X1 [Anneissia japonica]
MNRTVAIEGKAKVYTRLICILIGISIDSLSSLTIKTLTPRFVTFTDCANTTCPKAITTVPEMQVYGLSIVFASPEAMHILTLPFARMVFESTGFDLPLIIGLFAQACSSLCFAFGKSMALYIIARVFLGVGAAFIGTIGLRYIAESTNEPKTRDALFALVYCLNGFAVIGPTYSGVIVYFYGMLPCFLPLAILSFLCIIILVAVTRIQTNVSESVMTWYRNTDENVSCGELLLDPYVVLTAFGIALSQIPEACLAPGLALWITETYGLPIWIIGMAFIPAFFAYQVSILLSMLVTSKIPNHVYIITIFGYIFGAGGNVILSRDRGYPYFVAGLAIMVFSLTISKFCLVAILASVGRIRFSSSPGRIFSVFKLSALVPFVIGPIISLPGDRAIGLSNVSIITASMCLLFAPLIFILRQISSPYSGNEGKRLVEKKARPYVDESDASYDTSKETTESENEIPD